METCTGFHLFPNLPIEIQLRIWGIVLSTPRIVTLTCNRETFQSRTTRFAKSWTSNCPPPPLLHVNRDARFEALTIYKPYFTTPSSTNYIYLNLSLDTIKFADGALSYLTGTELQGIQKMVLDIKDSAYFGHFHMETLKEMKGLRQLDIWAATGGPYSWNRGESHVNTVTRDFEETKAMDPGWVCPRIRIFSQATGELARVIEGGARIPGWTEETAHLFEDADT